MQRASSSWSWWDASGFVRWVTRTPAGCSQPRPWLPDPRPAAAGSSRSVTPKHQLKNGTTTPVQKVMPPCSSTKRVAAQHQVAHETARGRRGPVTPPVVEGRAPPQRPDRLGSGTDGRRGSLASAKTPRRRDPDAVSEPPSRHESKRRATVRRSPPRFAAGTTPAPGWRRRYENQRVPRSARRGAPSAPPRPLPSGLAYERVVRDRAVARSRSPQQPLTACRGGRGKLEEDPPASQRVVRRVARRAGVARDERLHRRTLASQ